MTDEKKRRVVAASVSAARDVMIAAGVVLIALGAYELHRAAGHITLGALLAAMGLRGILRG
jgi:hypothetical protein